MCISRELSKFSCDWLLSRDTAFVSSLHAVLRTYSLFWVVSDEHTPPTQLWMHSWSLPLCAHYDQSCHDQYAHVFVWTRLSEEQAPGSEGLSSVLTLFNTLKTIECFLSLTTDFWPYLIFCIP